MPAPQRSIFRESAIRKYLQKQEQSVLLRVTRPPILLIIWIILFFLLGAGGLAWSIQVPTWAHGQGLVTRQEEAGQAESRVVVVLFFAANYLVDLHAGQPAIVSIGSAASRLQGRVTSVGTSAINPDEARSRFNLQGGLALIITGPSIPVVISIESTVSLLMYAGSLCDAQVQIGVQSVLSLLPGFRHSLGK